MVPAAAFAPTEAASAATPLPSRAGRPPRRPRRHGPAGRPRPGRRRARRPSSGRDGATDRAGRTGVLTDDVPLEWCGSPTGPAGRGAQASPGSWPACDRFAGVRDERRRWLCRPRLCRLRGRRRPRRRGTGAARAHRCTSGTSRPAPSSPPSAAGRCRWSTPAAGVLAEHTAVRTAVGLFDVSHLGKARVSGPGRRRLRQPLPDRRPRPDRSRPGAVHAALQRRRRRGRRPHRLPHRARRGAPHPQRRQRAPQVVADAPRPPRPRASS